MSEARREELIVAMQNANARLLIIAARMQRDLHRYGEWQSDWGEASTEAQRDYDRAEQQLAALEANAVSP